MTNTLRIELPISNKLTFVAGYAFGSLLYENHLEGKDFTKPVEIIIPSHITGSDSSLFGGLLGPLEPYKDNLKIVAENIPDIDAKVRNIFS